MSNNELEKIDHTLSAINEMGSKTDDLLEKKKNEQIMATGGAIAAREVRDIHEKWIASAREKLIEETKSGKITEAIGSYVLSWIRRSEEVSKKFVVDKTAQLNTRTGEVIALETSVKLLKTYYDSYSTKKAKELAALNAPPPDVVEPSDTSVVESPQPVSFAELIPDTVPPPQPKKVRKKRARPDEVGPLAKTVKRIKENRKTRSKS